LSRRKVFKFSFDNTVAALSKSLGEGRAVPLEFAQSSVAAPPRS
jgi:hypothetical protein